MSVSLRRVTATRPVHLSVHEALAVMRRLGSPIPALLAVATSDYGDLLTDARLLAEAERSLIEREVISAAAAASSTNGVPAHIAAGFVLPGFADWLVGVHVFRAGSSVRGTVAVIGDLCSALTVTRTEGADADESIVAVDVSVFGIVDLFEHVVAPAVAEDGQEPPRTQGDAVDAPFLLASQALLRETGDLRAVFHVDVLDRDARAVFQADWALGARSWMRVALRPPAEGSSSTAFDPATAQLVAEPASLSSISVEILTAISSLHRRINA